MFTKAAVVLLICTAVLCSQQFTQKWKKNSPVGIYTSTQISATTKQIFAGTSETQTQQNPDYAELLTFDSSVPVWTNIGQNQQVSVSRNANRVWVPKVLTQ
jgi:hypothetical protein